MPPQLEMLKYKVAQHISTCAIIASKLINNYILYTMAAPTVLNYKRAVLSIRDKVKIIEMLDKSVSYPSFI